MAALAVSVLAHAALFAAVRGVPLAEAPGAREAERRIALPPEPAPPPPREPEREARPPPPAASAVSRPPPRTTRPAPLAEPVSSDPLQGPAVSGLGGAPLPVARGSGAGGFGAQVESMRESGLDVVFALDATASMKWVIELVRERIGEVVSVVRSLVPASRFGLAVYRDRDEPVPVRVLPLTYRTERLRGFLDGVRAEGGGDLYEGVRAGLEAAIEESGFRSEAVRVVVLVGDAPPHPEETEALLRRVREFRRAGGTVTVLDVSLDSNPEVLRSRFGFQGERPWRGFLPQLEEIAQAGGGEISNLEGSEQVVRPMVVAIFGSEWVDWLIPFLGDA